MWLVWWHSFGRLCRQKLPFHLYFSFWYVRPYYFRLLCRYLLLLASWSFPASTHLSSQLPRLVLDRAGFLAFVWAALPPPNCYSIFFSSSLGPSAFFRAAVLQPTAVQSVVPLLSGGSAATKLLSTNTTVRFRSGGLAGSKLPFNP